MDGIMRTLEIVLVDDEFQITDILEAYIHLSIGDAKVHSFGDPCVAREFIAQNHVDVIITDYKMPKMNGVQLLESASFGTRKVIISGYASQFSEDRLRMLGAEFLQKPVQLGELAKILLDAQASLK
jgi:YesN/AraC family two-component response regulator